MRHRIARLFAPLPRLLRRPGRYSSGLVGPTVHHLGSQPARAARPAAVLGVGVGSVGLPWVIVGGRK
ncbi:hypothetical protein [Streptomyces osmaniensis]|uniref:hypothetical protein n=1 Tax=Streptomyces osmaniensis TaxID=593134 RepID=UPI001C32EE4A|nr:hypothetical protein KJK32_17685 [Streptomyces sp. JCM17656]